jgi:16S rRNA (cytosine967-C5)-methyltransferase
MRLYPNLVQAVVKSLMTIFNEGIYADKVLEKILKSDPRWGARDRGFIASTTYGIVRYKRKMEYYLGKEAITEKDWETIVGIYWIDQGESLEGERWSKIKLNASPEVRTIRESIPDWMDTLGETELQENWPKVLNALNGHAPIFIRVNTLKSTVAKVTKSLSLEKIEHIHKGNDVIQVETRARLWQLKAFKDGWFEVQDAHSQLIAPYLDAHPGMRVIDACAGGGGKALHLSSLMEGKGHIIAMDTEGWKLENLRTRAKRAGAGNIETRVIESSKTIKRLLHSCDRLLLDVPCSGMGVLRRNPDAKWKLTLEEINRLKDLQQDILFKYSSMVRPKGKMVYATCSILPSENSDQVNNFLNSNPDWSLEEMQTLFPEKNSGDGFFMARLRRN